MLEPKAISPPQGLRALINKVWRAEESSLITMLAEEALLSQEQLLSIEHLAKRLMTKIRTDRKKSSGIDSFLKEYALSSKEGVALMCLAEALLRVPDKATAKALIKDKLSGGDWHDHLGQSDSFFVNATTWALMLTGKVMKTKKTGTLGQILDKFINRSSGIVVHKAVKQAMRIMSRQFVMGRDISEAINRAKKKEAEGYRYSYDMLGEAALTKEDAERYFEAYKTAIKAIGEAGKKQATVYQRAGISVKLSALHPRYQEAQKEQVLEELPPRLLALAEIAKHHDIALTIDAEETERLDLSLDVIEKVFKNERLDAWEGFGVAVQSYQKRAFYVLDWLAALARSKNQRIMVRLIKGAYWDSEIKKAQMQGLTDYPVFTRKVYTDVSFQACAKKILTMTDALYPQFATHNAYSVAMIMTLVGDYRDFEFQCLHGMGNELYAQIVAKSCAGIPCRIYAPVGSHEDLLPYLVRRLLENGANSSFVNRIVDDKAPLAGLVVNPVEKATSLLAQSTRHLPLPAEIFLPKRQNSKGLDLNDRLTVASLQAQYLKMGPANWQAAPSGSSHTRPSRKQVSPQNIEQVIGNLTESNTKDIELALTESAAYWPKWQKLEVKARAACLHRYAELLEKNKPELMRMLCLEAGKTWQDALAEVREAIDFCYYYAHEALHLQAAPKPLHGYTGEQNELSLLPRGLVLCISPWNFPLAIFTGQIVAALVMGNAVLAKPAEQTPLIAAFAVKLMHEAGIPKAVIQLLPGSGEKVGAALVADKRIKAVLFTGSTATAQKINQSLATRGRELIPLIAETGGINAMIVDSSALLEQVVVDVLVSAFSSAGQRCSALRVLYVQEEVYPRLIQLLKGAMAELTIGDPQWLHTDVGPVIDHDALHVLQKHVARMRRDFEIIYQCQLPAHCESGYFMPPTAISIGSLSDLKQEVFGPILHVISYAYKKIDSILSDINASGYGLTFGVHSRINQRVSHIINALSVGNCYVNRNMIGAVVGLQPFGGQGLSGTGPKAGGPHYLLRLCQERCISTDTTAAGGNASLMALPEE